MKATTAVAAPQKSIEAVQHAVADRIFNLLYSNMGATPFDYRAATLQEVEQYSEPILRNIDAALQEPDTKQVNGIAKQIGNGCNQYSINDTIHFHRKTGASYYTNTIADVGALSYYPQVNQHIDLSATDEHTQKQCIALMTFATLIDSHSEASSQLLDYIDDLDRDLRVINDDALVALIANRPDDVERIAAMVIEDGISNAAVINGLLDGALPPVAEGHL